MYQQERMDEIMRLLKKHHYVTVDFLVNEINYSPASIRRDLTLLQKQGLITRSYGGATYKNVNISPFRFRQHSMKSAKNAIAKKAATLVKNDDTIFIDGSSTTQYIGRFLLDKKGIMVVTCNMLLADFLSEHGINTYCTGGKIIEHPGILGGELMINALSRFNFDLAFFASAAFNQNGQILSYDEISMRNHLIYRKNAKKLVYLCGSDKFDTEAKLVSLTLNDVEYFVSDENPSENIRKNFKKTAFLCTK